jgi:hypothetical protein
VSNDEFLKEKNDVNPYYLSKLVSQVIKSEAPPLSSISNQSNVEE